MRTLGHRTFGILQSTFNSWMTRATPFVCKMAKDLAEASSLVEAGFEYVTEIDDIKLFRKRS